MSKASKFSSVHHCPVCHKRIEIQPKQPADSVQFCVKHDDGTWADDGTSKIKTGYKIVCYDCPTVSVYRDEAEYLNNVPDSIHYCKGCGKPTLPANISRC